MLHLDGLRANIDWKSPFLKGLVGQFGPKFQVEDVPHRHSFVRFVRFVTIYAFDGQTAL